ncbi:phosphatase PAP2 family protein [Eubacteriaceae bacterium ES3]|nr:phosphatase PAP2 family protein [Eubacteriaceae bacterium ES3]
MLPFLITLDQNILIWIQESVRNDFLTPFFIMITKLGNAGVIWIITAMLLMISENTRKVGIMIIAALAITSLIDEVLLKNLVARPRPYEVVPGLQYLIEKQNTYSFPSGHSGSSFTAAVTIFLNLPKKFGVPALILATLIAFSRLYVGVHYLSDVLCGALIGSFVAVLVYKSSEFLMQKKPMV